MRHKHTILTILTIILLAFGIAFIYDSELSNMMHWIGFGLFCVSQVFLVINHLSQK